MHDHPYNVKGLDDWEKATLGGHMDDYFDDYADSPTDEEIAYEQAWIAHREFAKEERDQLLREREDWKRDYERLSDQVLGNHEP
jgi:hypothetical protein